MKRYDPTPRPGNFAAGVYPEPDPEPEPAPQSDPPTRDYTATVRLTGTVAGARVSVTKTIDLRRLEKFVGYLKRGGFTPDAPPVTYDRTPDGAPICPRHGVALRVRSKQGDEWHSHKVINDRGEELWCRGYPGPDSPGWNVPRTEAE